MANWDIVLPYDNRATDWLSDFGYPHPAARPGNRLPSDEELRLAWNALGLGSDDPLLVDRYDEAMSVRGDMVLELRFLRLLSERCGQLWLYPDTGYPAIIVDASLIPEQVASMWLEALAADDCWAVFYEQAYGSHD